jgi:hypothetical protein
MRATVMKDPREITDLAPQLAEALQRRTLALFIGADLPLEVTGLLSRTDLARDLARRKGLDESLSLAHVAQRAGRPRERNEFTAFILDALSGKSPQPFHRRIVETVQAHGFRIVVTIAYDDLLWLAFRDMGIGVNRVVHGSGTRFINPDRPTLIKLYGDVQDPETLVVTEDDHLGLWRDQAKEDVLDSVRTVLRQNTILFLGYNLSDPDFNLLWREVMDRVGRFPMGAYAIWLGLPEEDVWMWGDRNIVILDANLLGMLGEVAAQPVPPGCPEATVTVPAPSGLIRKQLAEARANLQLIEEREAEYVMSTEVPLQLVKEKRRLQQLVAKLEMQLGETVSTP